MINKINNKNKINIIYKINKENENKMVQLWLRLRLLITTCT